MVNILCCLLELPIANKPTGHGKHRLNQDGKIGNIVCVSFECCLAEGLARRVSSYPRLSTARAKFRDPMENAPMESVKFRELPDSIWLSFLH